jgi:class 3 adenylate cyclase
MDAAGRGGRTRLVLTLEIVGFGAARMLLRLAKNALLAVVLCACAASTLASFKDLAKYPAFERGVRLERRAEAPALGALRRLIPTNYEGRDIARPVVLVALFLLAMSLRGAAFRCDSSVARLRRRRDQYAKEASALLEPDKLDRAKLLEVYADVKKSLDKHKQNLAFLSIDVVDSTGMKLGEDPGIAENDFRRYKRMVEDILAAKHAVKSTWTPDGVMICFPSADLAVSAAQSVILSLEEFNRSVKAIKRDFAIRAGVNAGEVFCDAGTPMEEMTDRVIDIAGHMQKHGIVDGVTASKHSVEPFLPKLALKDAQRLVDGCPVYEWKKGDPL